MDVSNGKSEQTAALPGRFVSARRTLLPAVVCTFVVGCATWQTSHEAAISSFGSGDLRSSQEALQKSQKSRSSEKELLALDEAMLDLASGNLRQSETTLRTLRHELEFLEQKSIGEQTTSILSDSRAIAFSGRDFERRMILNMVMLTSVLGDGTDAFAYSLQATKAAGERRMALASAAEQESPAAPDSSRGLADSDSSGDSDVTTVSHSQSVSTTSLATPLDQPLALSAYLSAAIQSEQPSRSAETEKALSDVAYWNAAFSRHSQSASAGEMGIRCQKGHGTVHIIALVGKAPKWVSESAEPTSDALLIADRLISFAGKHTLPPTIASVKIACPEPSGSMLPADAFHCAISPEGGSANSLAAPLTFSTLVDLNEVARASYEANRNNEIAQAIVRRITKKGTIYALKETQNIHRNSLVDFGVNAAGVVWEAMEKPDTRSWRLLPGRIDVARTELLAGDWSASFVVKTWGNPAQTISVPCHVEDGRNTFVLCLIPEKEMTGHILVGGADRGIYPVGNSGPLEEHAPRSP